MLKKRVIFTLLYDNGSFMLSRNFRLQKVGDLQWLKKNYNFSELAFSIDELVLLDVTRTKRDHNKFIDHVRNLSEVCFIPIAAGGGIRDVKLAHRLVNNGADKIVINTLIGQSLETIRDIVAELGSQCVLASVDAKKIKNDYMVYTENGTLQQSFSLQEWLYKLAEVPVGEVYLNSIDRDGTGQGYQEELIEYIPANFPLPVILSGGAGKYQHFIEGLKHNKVDAVATAHLFNFIGSSLEDSRIALLNDGYNLAKWDMKICESIKDFFSPAKKLSE
jgi:imidazole glycerol-phosphate synthase subunit HisF